MHLYDFRTAFFFNILLFLPLGYLVRYVFSGWKFRHCVFAGALSSLLIESLQGRRVSRGREQYREIAEKLYQLGERTDLPGAKETQKAILLHLAEEMHRFPAFLEELQKRFPDLVEIPKQ